MSTPLEEMKKSIATPSFYPHQQISPINYKYLIILNTFNLEQKKDV